MHLIVAALVTDWVAVFLLAEPSARNSQSRHQFYRIAFFVIIAERIVEFVVRT